MAGRDKRDGPLEYACQRRVPKRFVYRLYQEVQFGGKGSDPLRGLLNAATKPDSGQGPKNGVTKVMRDKFRRIFNDLEQRRGYHPVLRSLYKLVHEEIQRERYLVFVRQRLKHDSRKVSFENVAKNFNVKIRKVQRFLNPKYLLLGIDQLHVDRVCSAVFCRVHASTRRYSVSFRKSSSQDKNIVTRK